MRPPIRLYDRSYRASPDPLASRMPALAPALRAAFSDAGPMDKAPYCPGGALAFYIGATDDPFPDETELACHLEEARGFVERAAHAKPRRGFLRRARAIIDANDAGDTARAWDLLEASLVGVMLDPARIRELASDLILGYGAVTVGEVIIEECPAPE